MSKSFFEDAVGQKIDADEAPQKPVMPRVKVDEAELTQLEIQEAKLITQIQTQLLKR
jgi:hypothetical protein